MQISPYLHFNGNCQEAFQFYERVLGGKIEALIPHAGTPAEAHVPPEWKDKIMHARLNTQGQALMASDTPPGRYNKPQGFSVTLDIKDIAEAERIYAALAENGNVTMPLQQTFWAARFAMFFDRFGIPWMINCAP
jgi:PhnB protein